MTSNKHIKYFFEGRLTFLFLLFISFSSLGTNPFEFCIEAEQVKRGVPLPRAKEIARLAIGGYETLDSGKAEIRVSAVINESTDDIKAAADLEARARAAKKRTSEMKAITVEEKLYQLRKKAEKENFIAQQTRDAEVKAAALRKTAVAKTEAKRVEDLRRASAAVKIQQIKVKEIGLTYNNSKQKLDALNDQGHELRALVDTPLYFGADINETISSRSKRLIAIKDARHVLFELKIEKEKCDRLFAQLLNAQEEEERLSAKIN